MQITTSRWPSAVLLAGAMCTACAEESGRTADVITVQTDAPPALLSVRDEAHAVWQTVPVMRGTTFDLAVTGAYQVVVVCQSGGEGSSFVVALYARTPDDDRTFHATCSTPVYPFELRGRMVQAAVVAFGNRGDVTSTTDPEFVVPTRPGVFDLVLLSQPALGRSDRIAIRRDITVTRDVDLGEINLTDEAVHDLVPVSIAIPDLRPSETVTSTVFLETGSTTIALDRAGLDVRRAPADALRPGDRQRISVIAAGAADGSPQFRSRTRIQVLADSAAPSLRLPDPLGPVTFASTAAELTAAWSALPEYTELIVERISFSVNPLVSRVHEVVLSRAFVEASGATSATLDVRGIPGFRREWQPDPTLTETVELVLRRQISETESESAVVGESHAAAATRTQKED